MTPCIGVDNWAPGGTPETGKTYYAKFWVFELISHYKKTFHFCDIIIKAHSSSTRFNNLSLFLRNYLWKFLKSAFPFILQYGLCVFNVQIICNGDKNILNQHLFLLAFNKFPNVRVLIIRLVLACMFSSNFGNQRQK